MEPESVMTDAMRSEFAEYAKKESLPTSLDGTYGEKYMDATTLGEIEMRILLIAMPIVHCALIAVGAVQIGSDDSIVYGIGVFNIALNAAVLPLSIKNAIGA